MKYFTFVPHLILIFFTMAACNSTEKKQEESSEPTTSSATITNRVFGTMPDGKEVLVYKLTNTAGMEVEIITYGGIITSLTAPDRDGRYEDIVLGYDNLEGYIKANPYFGALVGRYGNRIAKGKFSLDGTEYSLAINNMGNHLHGGITGFDKVVWEASTEEIAKGVGLKLTYTSADMEEGYPGNLNVEVNYFLDNKNALEIEYLATTDKKTVVNLTNHSYFNLSAMKEDILGHELQLNASKYVPVDETLIPLGELQPVAGTPFDFTSLKPIGRDINADDEQVSLGGGFDHCWSFDGLNEEVKVNASLYEPKSGRVMEVLTTEPGVQFYTGNFLDGSITGKNGVVYTKRFGLCLETQHYPDSPNQPNFPSVVLEPGDQYRTQTTYKFTAK